MSFSMMKLDTDRIEDLELGNVSISMQEDPSSQPLLDVADNIVEDTQNKSEVSKIIAREIVLELINDNMTEGYSKQTQDTAMFNINLLIEEFSMQHLWYEREWSEIRTTAAKNLLLGFIPTCSDIYSDIQLFLNYWYGVMYLKTVDTINHEYVNSTNCTLEYKTVGNRWNWNGTHWMEPSVTYTYSCFETDPIYAWVTFAFIFGAPAYMFIDVVHSFTKGARAKCIACLFLPIVMALYPFALVLCKIISVFHKGKEFKKLSNRLAGLEGVHEAAPQLCILIYILCSRKDRHPTNMQWFSLVTSAIAVNLPQIEAFNMTKPPPDGTKEEILRILKLLPLFLTTALFRILSFAIVFILLKGYGIVMYACVFSLSTPFLCSRSTAYLFSSELYSAFTIRNFQSENKPLFYKKFKYTEEEEKKIKVRYRQYHMVFWFIVHTVTLLILLTVANSSSDIELFPNIIFGGTSFLAPLFRHSWNNIPIIANIMLLNSLIVSTLLFGIVSLVLFYFQVDQKVK